LNALPSGTIATWHQLKRQFLSNHKVLGEEVRDW